MYAILCYYFIKIGELLVCVAGVSIYMGISKMYYQLETYSSPINNTYSEITIFVLFFLVHTCTLI